VQITLNGLVFPGKKEAEYFCPEEVPVARQDVPPALPADRLWSALHFPHLSRYTPAAFLWRQRLFSAEFPRILETFIQIVLAFSFNRGVVISTDCIHNTLIPFSITCRYARIFLYQAYMRTFW